MEEMIGIIGGGGFAREVADIAYCLDKNPVLVIKQGLAEDQNLNYQYVYENSYNFEKFNTIIGIGDNLVRYNLVKSFENKTKFVNLIHPTATFGRNQLKTLENYVGIIICSGVRVTNNVKFGSHIIVNLNSTIGHDVIIEDFVNIAPGCNISGNVHIGKLSYIGSGAVIIQGTEIKKLRIGENAVIGAGAVVVSDCEPNSVYVGIPAKRIR